MEIQTFNNYIITGNLNREDALRSIVEVDLFISAFSLDENNELKDNIRNKRIQILPSVWGDRRMLEFLSAKNKEYHEILRLQDLLSPILKDHMLVEGKSGRLLANKGFLLSNGRRKYVFGFTPEESYIEFSKQVVSLTPIDKFKKVLDIYDEAKSIVKE